MFWFFPDVSVLDILHLAPVVVRHLSEGASSFAFDFLLFAFAFASLLFTFVFVFKSIRGLCRESHIVNQNAVYLLAIFSPKVDVF